MSRYIYNNGIRYFNKNNFEAAISELRKSLRGDIQCLSPHIILGDALKKTGNDKSALQAWKTGYKNTNSPVCLMRLEKFYRESDQIGEMVKVYEEAIQNAQNSTRETLGLLLSSLYLEEGNPEKTIQVIEKI